MKVTYTTVFFLPLSLTSVISLSIPQSDLILRDAAISTYDSSNVPTLEKRRGGGGGGRGGGGSSGGSSGGRSGSSGSSGSSSSSGSTRSQPSYGGGTYYAGGAKTPYKAGTRSPLGVTPFLLPVAALAVFPGIWLYGAYAYPYSHHYNYRNESSHQNESMPIVCLCQEYSPCGCDDNNNRTYYESLFNGTQPTNSSVAKVVNVNGTDTIYINGTLPNDTSSDSSTSSGSPTHSVPGAALLQFSGYWVMAALVFSTVWVL